MFYNRFKKGAAAWGKSHWYHDFTRGVTYVQIQMAQVPESVFSEAERIRLSYHLMKINKKLFHAYRLLGQQAIDCVTGISPLVSEEDLERLYQQIERILEDQKRVEAEMEELRLASSMKEGS